MLRFTASLIGLLFACMGGAQSLTLTVSDSQLRADHELSLVVVRLDALSAYDELTDYDEVFLSYQQENYRFDPPPEQLSLTEVYTVEYAGQEYTLYFTELPLVAIHTTEPIPDEPKVAADFVYADADQVLHATVGIELRGGSSQFYPKLTYDLEFWEDETGAETQEVQFSDLRSDDDWILDALYNEPLRLRSYVAHQLWLDLHTPSYQTEEPEAKAGAGVLYVEVFLDGRYRGVYNLSEQIDRKLLKLKKFDGSIRGELFKGVTWGASTFGNLPFYSNNSRSWGGYELKYPKQSDTTEWQQLYEFTDFVLNASDTEFSDQLWNYFDYANYLDYFIFLNLLRATDNTGKNIYLARYDVDSPYFYAPWDLDGCFGTIWDGSNEAVTDDLLTNGLHERVIALDPQNYSVDVADRWAALRGGILNEADLAARFTSRFHYLQDHKLYEREGLAFPEYDTDQNDLNYLTDWLYARLAFLDSYFDYTSEIRTAPVGAVPMLFPNPATTEVFLPENIPTGEPYHIFDSTGRVVRRGTFVSEVISLNNLPAGVYLIRISSRSLRFVVQ